jgi:hypothetical protein
VISLFRGHLIVGRSRSNCRGHHDNPHIRSVQNLRLPLHANYLLLYANTLTHVATGTAVKKGGRIGVVVFNSRYANWAANSYGASTTERERRNSAIRISCGTALSRGHAHEMGAKLSKIGAQT